MRQLLKRSPKDQNTKTEHLKTIFNSPKEILNLASHQ